MLGVRSYKEDYSGANPEYPEALYCEECGGEIICDGEDEEELMAAVADLFDNNFYEETKE